MHCPDLVIKGWGCEMKRNKTGSDVSRSSASESHVANNAGDVGDVLSVELGHCLSVLS